MSSARAYRPAERFARDPIVAERALRIGLALLLFAGFFALGRGTGATAGAGEAMAPTLVSVSRPAAAVPAALAQPAPLEAAFAERATVERAEIARAAAVARARRRPRRPALVPAPE